MSAVALAASLLPGIHYEGGIRALLIITLVFGGVNLLIRPILKTLALPVEIATIGLATVAINAAMLLLVSRIVIGFTILPFPFPGFSRYGFLVEPFMLPAWGTAVIGAIMIGMMVTFMYWLTEK